MYICVHTYLYIIYTERVRFALPYLAITRVCLFNKNTFICGQQGYLHFCLIKVHVFVLNHIMRGSSANKDARVLAEQEDVYYSPGRHVFLRNRIAGALVERGHMDPV